MNRGYIDFQTETVRWGGRSAVYSRSELAILAELTEAEQQTVHLLKALCGGEIIAPDDPCLDLSAPIESLQNEKGPAPATPKRRRKGEPLSGQTTIAV